MLLLAILVHGRISRSIRGEIVRSRRSVRIPDIVIRGHFYPRDTAVVQTLEKELELDVFIKNLLGYLTQSS